MELKTLLFVLLAAVAVDAYYGRGAGYHGYHGYHGKPGPRPAAAADHHHHYHATVHNHYGSDGHAGAGHGFHDSDRDHGHDYGHGGRVYTFQLGQEFGPYEFIDENDGVLKGFHVDLLLAVCAEAKKNCRYVLDLYSNCWKTDGGIETPGEGLLAGWYDACVGVYPTPARYNSFNFSASFTENFKVKLVYSGGDIEGDPTDLTGRKVGLIQGFHASKNCLARQSSLSGNRPGEYTQVYFESDQERFEALKAGEIDLFIEMKEYVPDSWGFQFIEPGFYCTEGGTALMARYKNQEVLNWWNSAFDRMRQNGSFRRLCQKGEREYGHRGELYCVA